MGYADVILADRPVAYWPLGETSGVVANDVSGNGRHGTYTGNMTLGAPGPLTRQGENAAASFPGTSFDGDRVDIPDLAPLLVQNSFTFEVWVYHFDTGERHLLHVWSSGTIGEQLQWWVRPGTQQLLFGGLSGGTLSFSPYIPPVNVWRHYAVSFDAPTKVGKLYMDGAVVSSAVQTSAFVAPTSVARIGARAGGTSGAGPMKGRMAHFAVYDRALSAEQISLHCRAGRPAVGWWGGSWIR